MKNDWGRECSSFHPNWRLTQELGEKICKMKIKTCFWNKRLCVVVGLGTGRNKNRFDKIKTAWFITRVNAILQRYRKGKFDDEGRTKYSVQSQYYQQQQTKEARKDWRKRNLWYVNEKPWGRGCSILIIHVSQNHFPRNKRQHRLIQTSTSDSQSNERLSNNTHNNYHARHFLSVTLFLLCIKTKTNNQHPPKKKKKKRRESLNKH